MIARNPYYVKFGRKPAWLLGPCITIRVGMPSNTYFAANVLLSCSVYQGLVALEVGIFHQFTFDNV